MKTIPDTISFHFHNANPKNRNTTDCVVRAIATATGKGWDEVLVELTETAIKHKQMINDPACFGKYLESLGWEKRPQPRKDNGKKFTGKEFVKYFKGTAVANIGGGHTTCFKYGVAWDTWDCTDGTIGNYWTKG